MRIGIFAGTFDPVHIGHTTFAELATKEANLDKVILVAEKEPYRKKPHASWDHRQAMIERATKNIESVDHDYQFAAMLSHRHTLSDMLQTARNHYGEENAFWFLVGSDIFDHIHKWHDVAREADYGGFVVALRKDHTKASVLQTYKQSGLSESNIIFVSNPYPETSSSMVRAKNLANLSSSAIESDVDKYIRFHQLYQK